VKDTAKLRAPIGHLAIAKNEISTNQGFKSITPIREEMSLYIYRWLQYYAPTIDKNATGTTFKEVSGKQVEAQFVPLPPLAEQSRIVAKTTELLNLLTQLESQMEE
jgi:type I restriction enzyme S subunit